MTWANLIDLVRALAWPGAVVFLAWRLTLPVCDEWHDERDQDP